MSSTLTLENNVITRRVSSFSFRSHLQVFGEKKRLQLFYFLVCWDTLGFCQIRDFFRPFQNFRISLSVCHGEIQCQKKIFLKN